MKKSNKKDNKDAPDDENALIFKPGTLVLAQNKNKEWRDAKIVETRKTKHYASNPIESNLEFYVHYEALNRR